MGTPFLFTGCQMLGIVTLTETARVTRGRIFLCSKKWICLGAGRWPTAQRLTSGSACDWENLPVWLLRPGCLLAPGTPGESRGSSGPLPLGAWLPPALDLVQVSPPRNVSPFDSQSVCYYQGLYKGRRDSCSQLGVKGWSENQRGPWEIRRALRWMSRTMYVLLTGPETISHPRVQGQKEISFRRLIC